MSLHLEVLKIFGIGVLEKYNAKSFLSVTTLTLLGFSISLILEDLTGKHA